MKNLLWFLHKPTDEREHMLYKKAYERILSFIAIVFLLALVGFMFAPVDTTVPAVVIEFTLWTLFVISVLIGWSAVRDEELDADVPRKKIKLWTLLAVIAIVVANFIVITLINPTLFFPAGVITMFLIHIVFVVFAWNATRGIVLTFRLLLSLVFPLFTLVFLTSDVKNPIGRVIASIIMTISLYIILIVSMAMMIGTIQGTVVTPVYISTNHFEPELKKDDVVYVDMRIKEYAVNDYMMFIDPEGKLRIGKVVMVENNIIKVDTSAGKMEVSEDDRRGKLLLDSSPTKWLDRFVNFKNYVPKLLTQ